MWFYNPQKDKDSRWNKLVAYFDAPYCHSELQFENGLSCTIYMNTKVKFIQREFSSTNYTCLQIECTNSQYDKAYILACEKEGHDFGIFNMVNSLLKLPINVNGTYCSKLNAEILVKSGILKEDVDYNMITPSGLFREVREVCTVIRHPIESNSAKPFGDGITKISSPDIINTIETVKILKGDISSARKYLHEYRMQCVIGSSSTYMISLAPSVMNIENLSSDDTDYDATQDMNDFEYKKYLMNIHSVFEEVNILDKNENLLLRFRISDSCFFKIKNKPEINQYNKNCKIDKNKLKVNGLEHLIEHMLSNTITFKKHLKIHKLHNLPDYSTIDNILKTMRSNNIDVYDPLKKKAKSLNNILKNATFKLDSHGSKKLDLDDNFQFCSEKIFKKVFFFNSKFISKIMQVLPMHMQNPNIARGIAFNCFIAGTVQNSLYVNAITMQDINLPLEISKKITQNTVKSCSMSVKNASKKVTRYSVFETYIDNCVSEDNDFQNPFTTENKNKIITVQCGKCTLVIGSHSALFDFSSNSDFNLLHNPTPDYDENVNNEDNSSEERQLKNFNKILNLQRYVQAVYYRFPDFLHQHAYIQKQISCLIDSNKKKINFKQFMFLKHTLQIDSPMIHSLILKHDFY